MTQLYSGKGAGPAAHLHLRDMHEKQRVSVSTQKRHFQNDIINDLWGILGCNFTETFWGHQRLILHIVKRGVICLL